MTDLGPLGPRSALGSITGVNDLGQVVGVRSNGTFNRAFVWTAADGFLDLGIGGGSNAVAGINNAGQVAGSYSPIPGGTFHGFSWTATGGLVDLGTLGGNTAATALNDAGQIVGWSAIPSGTEHAFSWTAATGLINLGTLGGFQSYAAALNAHGQVVGYSTTIDDIQHAALWDVLPTDDTTPPTLNLPPNIIAEATDGAGATVTYTASAVDDVDGPLPAACTPVSSTVFPIATTMVNCTAADKAGNMATGSFTVTVQDSTPPALMLPSDITVPATSTAGAVVIYGARAKDLVDGDTTVTCTPPSGYTFPVGSTKVTCTSTDRHGNTATGSFMVTVTAPNVVAGHMEGHGKIASGNLVHHFHFNVREDKNGLDSGSLDYETEKRKGDHDHDGRHDDRHDRFHSTKVTDVAFSFIPVPTSTKPPVGPNRVVFSGVGAWNGRFGYTFEAVAVDLSELRRGQDRFTLTIRDGEGNVVSSVDGALTEGDIKSLKP
jgi:probable HAF family extracellular repeat protein